MRFAEHKIKTGKQYDKKRYIKKSIFHNPLSREKSYIKIIISLMNDLGALVSNNNTVKTKRSLPLR